MSYPGTLEWAQGEIPRRARKAGAFRCFLPGREDSQPARQGRHLSWESRDAIGTLGQLSRNQHQGAGATQAKMRMADVDMLIPKKMVLSARVWCALWHFSWPSAASQRSLLGLLGRWSTMGGGGRCQRSTVGPYDITVSRAVARAGCTFFAVETEKLFAVATGHDGTSAGYPVSSSKPLRNGPCLTPVHVPFEGH